MESHEECMCDEMKSDIQELNDTVIRLIRERDYYKNLIRVINIAVPDMVWAKDKKGNYTYVNQQIVNGLLMSDTIGNTLGRNDVQLARGAKDKVGDSNHTFGEVCGNSDVVVAQHQKPMHFVEHGKVNGELLILDVHKNVLRDYDGNIIGTCGTGRDITEEYLFFNDIANKIASYDKSLAEEVLDFTNRNKFNNQECHYG